MEPPPKLCKIDVLGLRRIFSLQAPRGLAALGVLYFTLESAKMMENAEGCFRHVARCRRLGEPIFFLGRGESYVGPTCVFPALGNVAQLCCLPCPPPKAQK